MVHSKLKITKEKRIRNGSPCLLGQVIKQEDNLPLYLISGLESGLIKTIHRDHLILFHQSTPTKLLTIDQLPSWENMNNKYFETHEEYCIKKQLNKKISIFYGNSTTLQADMNITIDKKVSESEIIEKLKDARQNNQHTAIFTINETTRITDIIRVILCVIRKDLSHKDWIKIIVSTENHVIFNRLLEEMCTYFPKTTTVKEHIQFSESDDSSDCSSEDEYYPNHINHQDDLLDNSINSDTSTIDSDSEDDVVDQPRYNLRRAGRRPPAYLGDYVVHTLVPQ